MERIFLCVLSLSLSGALAGTILLLIHPLTKKWFSRRWNYYIWLLLIARLVLPLHFGAVGGLRIPIRSAAYLTAETGNEKTEGTDRAESELKGADGGKQVGAPGLEKADGINQTEKGDKDGQAAAAQTPPSFSGKARENRLVFPAVLWLLGACVSLFMKIWNYRRFAAGVGRDRERLSDSGIITQAEDTAVRLCMKRAPAIYESGRVSGPITLGLCKPAVILPKEFVAGFSEGADGRNQLCLVLHHEFIHIKRKDLWYKWLYQALLCVHWFNPVLYLAGRKLNADCELACDEAVVASLTGEGKKAYGNILINAAEWSGTFRRNIPYTTLLERRQDLKERLKGILHYKKQKKIGVLISVCTALGLLGLTACGSVRISGEETSLADSAKEESKDEGFWQSMFSAVSGEEAEKFILSTSIVNKHGAAFKMYDDDILVAGDDANDQWRAYHYAGGNGVTAKGFALNGSHTILIAEAVEDTTLKVETSYELVDGKFKTVCIKPDGSVEVIDDTGEHGVFEVTLEKGRNVIKMVGQGAKLKELSISFPKLNKRDFAAVYNSESEEYADKILQEIQSGKAMDREKVFETLAYMEDEEVSEVLAALLERKESLNADEMCDLFIYSDKELSTKYLTEAVARGDITPDKEMVDSLMPYLDDGGRGRLLNALGKDLDWTMICESMPYLSDNERRDCVLQYLGNGNTITFSQYEEISPYLSSDATEAIDRYLEGR